MDIQNNNNNIDVDFDSDKKSDLKLKVDGHYTKSEIDGIRKKSTEIISMSQNEISKLGDWINKDVRIASEIYISKSQVELKSIFKILKKKGVLSKGLSFKGIDFTGPEGIGILQNALTALGQNPGKTDKLFGKNTFQDLMKWQGKSSAYIVLGGLQDGIPNGRTMKALLEELQNNYNGDEVVGNDGKGGGEKSEREFDKSVECEIDSNVLSKKSGTIYSQHENDNIGAVNVDREAGTQVINETELSQKTRDLMKEKIAELGDKNLERSIEQMMKKSDAYLLLYSFLLVEADFAIKNNGNMLGWGKYVNDDVTFNGKKMKHQIEGAMGNYSTIMMNLSAAICSGDKDKIKTEIANMDKFVFGDFTNDMRAWSIMGDSVKQMTGTYDKYEDRFNKGDTDAVYEFMTNELNNEEFLNYRTFNNFDGKHDQNIILNDTDENSIDNHYKNKEFSFYGVDFSYPSDIDYGDLVIDARGEISDMNNGVVDAGYITQKISKIVLLEMEEQIRNSFIGKPEADSINLFFENTGFFDDLFDNGSLYVQKGMALASITALTMGGTSAGIGMLGLNSGLISSGVGMLGELGALHTTMTVGGGLINGQSFGDSINELSNVDGWMQTAMFMGVLKVVQPLLLGISSTSMAKGVSGSISAVKGGKFLLKGVNFGTQVGTMIGVNHIMFDGEFTPEEIVNTIVMVGLMSMNGAKITKKGSEIEILRLEHVELLRLEHLPAPKGPVSQKPPLSPKGPKGSYKVGPRSEPRLKGKLHQIFKGGVGTEVPIGGEFLAKRVSVGKGSYELVDIKTGNVVGKYNNLGGMTSALEGIYKGELGKIYHKVGVEGIGKSNQFNSVSTKTSQNVRMEDKLNISEGNFSLKKGNKNKAKISEFNESINVRTDMKLQGKFKQSLNKVGNSTIHGEYEISRVKANNYQIKDSTGKIISEHGGLTSVSNQLSRLTGKNIVTTKNIELKENVFEVKKTIEVKKGNIIKDLKLKKKLSSLFRGIEVTKAGVGEYEISKTGKGKFELYKREGGVDTLIGKFKSLKQVQIKIEQLSPREVGQLSGKVKSIDELLVSKFSGIKKDSIKSQSEFRSMNIKLRAELSNNLKVVGNTYELGNYTIKHVNPGRTFEMVKNTGEYIGSYKGLGNTVNKIMKLKK